MWESKSNENEFVIDVPDKAGVTRKFRMRRHILDDHYQVVIVSAARFLACWPKHDVPQLSSTEIQYWERRFADMDDASVVEMPFVYVDKVTCVEKKFMGLFRKTLSGIAVSFSNGRHRATYLLSAGATNFPVLVDGNDANLLAQFCGYQEPPVG